MIEDLASAQRKFGLLDELCGGSIQEGRQKRIGKKETGRYKIGVNKRKNEGGTQQDEPFLCINIYISPIK